MRQLSLKLTPPPCEGGGKVKASLFHVALLEAPHLLLQAASLNLLNDVNHIGNQDFATMEEHSRVAGPVKVDEEGVLIGVMWIIVRPSM